MRKCTCHLLPVLFFVFWAGTGFGQQIDSMMGVYADRLAPEKIHIHFDKSVYNKGETIWYKIYLMQGRDTAAPSMNIYLEWYDGSGKPITHTVAPLLLSTSQGSFDIPADYKDGSLHVKAFTRWMLNDDPAFSYWRELVINTNTVGPTKPATGKTTVAIFPESGFLIQGLQTRVAFKAADQFGTPVFVKGVVADDQDNTIDSLHIQHDGMGSFYLVPEPGRRYQLNWTDGSGATGITPVPVTKTTGAQLTITRTKDKARFRVERTPGAPENFSRMTLVVHMNRVGLYQVAINTSDKTRLSSEIPVSDLPTGLLQFTLFTSDWIPIAERVIFINNRSHAFDVKLSSPLVNLAKRGKNTLEVFVPDTLFTNMSLSITDAAVNPPDPHTIFSDILLSSEIRGKIFNPGYYLSGDTDSISEHLDLVMLTNGWRRFDWDKIRMHIAPKVEYAVETSYMKLNGQVSGMKKNDPAAELNLVVLNKDSSRQFISVPVAKDGSFEYPMAFFDTAKVFYSFNNNKTLAEKAKLQINNGLLQLSPKSIATLGTTPSLWNDSQTKQKLDALLAQQEMLQKMMSEATLKEVTVTTKVKTKLELVNEKYTSGFFRGNPARRSYAFDLTTDPDKLIIAQSALGYLQNRVPGLVVRCASMLDCQVSWGRQAIAPPDFYLNEMPTTLDMVMNIPVTDIALVKAFPPPFFYSSTGMLGGAIAIYTKKPEDYQQPEIKGLPDLLLAGYSKFKEFYNPSYDEPGEGFTKTDNRTTLYWSPNLITNKTEQRIHIDFFNNDFTKTFNVVLEGINAAGKMTRIVRTIDADTKN